MSKQRKNPNSSIRNAYRLEDLHVLRLCIDWLKNPASLSCIRVQYVPEAYQGSHFAIDDVVAELNGICSFYQAKHIQNPATDHWTLDKLIEKGLAKWIQSFHNLDQQSLSGCFFLSDGHPSLELNTCLHEGHLLYDTLLSNFPTQISALQNDFTQSQLRAFFAGFSFIFSLPQPDAYFEQLKDELCQDLKVTEDGVNSLALFIHHWASSSQPAALKLLDIRTKLSWDDPRPLNQNFLVPDDFEFFDKLQHQTLLKDIHNPEGGIRVIIGKPGAGKSTYLSKLYDTLKKQNIPAARHHYHLNPKDSSFRERLNTKRAVEALRAEFKKQKKRGTWRIKLPKYRRYRLT